MKLTIQNKSFQKAGAISLVQFGTLERPAIDILPGAPAIEKGDLVITEMGQQGDVQTLRAVNRTDHYFLLTDMDLLAGAKQNRVLNTSVLIAPDTKQEISVSCVERSRWDLISREFKPGKTLLDMKARSLKAAFLQTDEKEKKTSSQWKIWSMIESSLEDKGIHSDTEDYMLYLSDREAKKEKSISFAMDEACNGMGVFAGKKLMCFDVFGNTGVYSYYFGRLSNEALAFNYYETGKVAGDSGLGEAEAFYRLEDAMDGYIQNLEKKISAGQSGPGELSWSGLDPFSGFGLEYKGAPVHIMGTRVTG